MRIRKKAFFAILLLFVLTASNATVSAQAPDLDTQKRALDIIADFADKFCKTIPLHGEAKNFELSTQGKAELSKLLKKIADLGFQGAAKYQKSEYVGALQQDIATLQKDNMTCRTMVWGDLKNKLIEQEKPIATTGTKPKPSVKTDAKETKDRSGGQLHGEREEVTVNGNYNSVVKIKGGSGNTTTTNIITK